MPARQLQRSAFAVILAIGASIGGGCNRPAAMVLHQPSAPPSQQEVHLQSRWTFSSAAAGRQNYLLAFPLPGARDGPRDFLLYVSAPAGTGTFAADRDDPDAVRGFLIQAVGHLAGKTAFKGGTLRVRGVWLRPQQRRLDTALECEDGTLVTGRAIVRQADLEIRDFEQRYAGDVAILSSTGPRGADEPQGTRQRTTSSP